MKEDIRKLQINQEKQQKEINDLRFMLKKLTDTSFKTGTREIINREVQFLQKVYDKSGGLVTEINN